MTVTLMGTDREVLAIRVKMQTVVWMLAGDFTTLSALSTVAMLRAATNWGKVLASRFWDKKQKMMSIFQWKEATLLALHGRRL